MKFTDKQIKKIIKKARSFNELRKLLGAGNSGSSYMWIKERVKKLKLDISHFNPNWYNVGNYSKRKWEDVLFYNKKLKQREKIHILRRSILEYGFNYCCSVCSIKDWKNKKITLHIDHIDGNWRNNNPKNLRFICPNCHSQTNNYGNKKNKKNDC